MSDSQLQSHIRAIKESPDNLLLWEQLFVMAVRQNKRIMTRANPECSLEEVTHFVHTPYELEGEAWLGWPETGFLKINTDEGVLYFDIQEHGHILANNLLLISP
jgi:hypothetical protein